MKSIFAGLKGNVEYLQFEKFDVNCCEIVNLTPNCQKMKS